MAALTKASAEAALAQLPLAKAVAVLERVRDVSNLRVFRYEEPSGQGVTEIELPEQPTDDDLESLIRNIPIPANRRAAAKALFQSIRQQLVR